MTDLFKRIRQDPDILGGQAYIDKTKITVNELVQQSLNGASLAELKKVYPQLTHDDIHQALSYAMSDILKGVSFWRHDGMTPLTQIKGFSEILVGKTDFDDLESIPSEQKQQWLMIIHESSQRGIARWQQMGQWLTHNYAPLSHQHEIIPVSQLLEDAKDLAFRYEPVLEIIVNGLDDSIAIECPKDLAIILASLMTTAKNTFSSPTTININCHEASLTLAIVRPLQYPDDNISKLLSIPFNPIATAQVMFHQNQFPFEIAQDESNIIFQVSLPIWSEEDS